MKKPIKILAIIVSVLLGIIFLVFLYVNLSDMPKHEVKDLPIKVTYDSTSVFQGKKIVETVCWTCHQGDDGRLSGTMFSQPESAFGEIWTANITNHATQGIGRYSDGELAYMLRTGINRDGRFIGPFMLFPNMADQDLAAIIAYLRSDSPVTKGVDVKRPAPSYSFLAKALFKLGAMKPLSAPEDEIVAPPVSDAQNYGKYLATAVFACYECHSKSFETNNVLHPEHSEGYFAGGNPVEDRDFNLVFSSNLTPSRTSGIGSWNRDDFDRAIRTGISPNQKLLNSIMPRFSLMSDVEVDAIWTYLQSLEPVDVPEMVASK
ncbi:MAG: cytochrome c [Saprospiraceae bacterium]|nr:cytochrome c [Saprospiraceae bacterium]